MWSMTVNDVLLRIDDNGRSHYEEPGIAWLTDQGTIFGKEALARLFVSPVQCQTTFWQRMNEDGLQAQTRHITKSSDLVYNQIADAFDNLGSLSKKGWVVVPSDYDATQVGLLLGILEYKNIHPRGFVDRAVMDGGQWSESTNQPFFYVDLHLERTVVTKLVCTNGVTTVNDATALSSAGYLQLFKRWIDVVAQRSLDETRFDPRVSGNTEQQVFDRLRERIADHEDMIISVQHNNEIRSTGVQREDLTASTADIYDRIASVCDPNALVVVSDQAANMPGLRSYLDKLGHRVESGTPSESNSVIERFDAFIPDNADVQLHSSAPLTVTTSSLSEQHLVVNQRATTAPTHILSDHTAMPIGAKRTISLREQIVCGIERVNGDMVIEPTSDQTIYINNIATSSRTPVHTGDRVLIGQIAEPLKEFVFIHVIHDE